MIEACVLGGSGSLDKSEMSHRVILTADLKDKAMCMRKKNEKKISLRKDFFVSAEHFKNNCFLQCMNRH